VGRESDDPSLQPTADTRKLVIAVFGPLANLAEWGPIGIGSISNTTCQQFDVTFEISRWGKFETAIINQTKRKPSRPPQNTKTQPALAVWFMRQRIFCSLLWRCLVDAVFSVLILDSQCGKYIMLCKLRLGTFRKALPPQRCPHWKSPLSCRRFSLPPTLKAKRAPGHHEGLANWQKRTVWATEGGRFQRNVNKPLIRGGMRDFLLGCILLRLQPLIHYLTLDGLRLEITGHKNPSSSRAFSPRPAWYLRVSR